MKMADSPLAPTAESLSALKRASEVALLRRWLSGELLPQSDMAALMHVLPAEVLANPPSPDYPESADAYALQMGVSRRTIFRWIATGRDKRARCPLDRPSDMVAWFERLHGRRAPDELTAWVAKRSNQAPPIIAQLPLPPAGAGSPPSTEPGVPPAREAIDMNALAGTGLEGAIAVLKQQVAANASLLANAYNDPSDDALTHYQSRFEKSVEQLRKAEKSALELAKARGDLAPRSEFRSDLMKLSIGLRGMHRRMVDNVVTELKRVRAAGELAMDEAAFELLLGHVSKAVESVRGRELTQLRSARHWQQMPDGSVQPAAA